MQDIKTIISQPKFREVIRFGIVGGIATVLQVLIYWLLAPRLNHNLALVISYVISLAVNFLLTVYFTFQVKPTARKGMGFLASHAVNLTLQFLLLNLFIRLGVDRQLAIVPVLAVCIPINFLLVRLSVKKL